MTFPLIMFSKFLGNIWGNIPLVSREENRLMPIAAAGALGSI